MPSQVWVIGRWAAPSNDYNLWCCTRRASSHKTHKSSGIQGCAWVYKSAQGAHGYTSVYMGIQRCTWVYMGVHEYTSMYMGIQRCTWVYMGIEGCTWVYMSIQGCTWVYKGVASQAQLWVPYISFVWLALQHAHTQKSPGWKLCCKFRPVYTLNLTFLLRAGPFSKPFK